MGGHPATKPTLPLVNGNYVAFGEFGGVVNPIVNLYLSNNDTTLDVSLCTNSANFAWYLDSSSNVVLTLTAVDASVLNDAIIATLLNYYSVPEGVRINANGTDENESAPIYIGSLFV